MNLNVDPGACNVPEEYSAKTHWKLLENLLVTVVHYRNCYRERGQVSSMRGLRERVTSLVELLVEYRDTQRYTGYGKDTVKLS